MLSNKKYLKYALSSLIVFLLLAAAAYWVRNGKQILWDRPADFFVQLEQGTSAVISDIEREHQQVSGLSQQHADPLLYFEQLETAVFKYPTFLVRNGELVYWSDFKYVPDVLLLKGIKKSRFIQKEKSSYLAIASEGADANSKLISLICLQYVPEVVNQYFSSNFNEELFLSNDFNLAAPEIELEYRVKYQDEQLFSISFGEDYTSQSEWLVYVSLLLEILCYLAAIVVLYFFVFAFQLHNLIRWPLFALLVIMVRIGYNQIALPFGYELLAVFDPKFYASSVINPSLGDLLMNIYTFLGLSFLFFLQHLKDERRYGLISNVIYAVFTFWLLYFNFWLVESIYLHSQWGLDITDEFDTGKLKYLSLLILIFSSVIYFLFSHLLAVQLLRRTRGEVALIILLAGVLFALTAFFLDLPFLWVLAVHSVYLWVCYTFDLAASLNEFKFSAFLYLFLSTVSYSLVGTHAIQYMEQIELADEQEQLAGNLLLDNDPLLEYLLAELNDKIAHDVFIINRMMSPFSSKEIIKEKIRRYYLTDYFEKYDVDIQLFNASGIEVAVNPIHIDLIKSSFFRDEFATGVVDVYLTPSNLSVRGLKYISYIPLQRMGNKVGAIVLNLRLKRIATENVYPELLKDQRFFSAGDQKFDYAIFNADSLVHSFGSYNYQNTALFSFDDVSKARISLLQENNFVHRAYHDGGQRWVIISGENDKLYGLVSNFSFLFILHFTLVVLSLFIYAFFLLYRREQLSLAFKIQLFFNLAFFFPLIVIAIAAVTFMYNSFKDEKSQQFLANTENLSFRLEDVIEARKQEQLDHERFEDVLEQIAKYAGIDLNVYDLSGRLMGSSQPQIFSKSLLSDYINPSALKKILLRGEKLFLEDEVLGNLQYLSAYVAIKSLQSGEVIGILSSPFYQSEREEQSRLFGVLTIIMNAFTVIFLLFLILVYYASRNLTSPLRLISQKLGVVSFAEENEPLHWNAEDEIGLLIKEYNKMLHKLEKSKAELARTEKESAWREMARQVAHEIKNPLTPMKLSLQHLSRVLLQNVGSEHKSIKTIDSLLRQIDTLSDIASSFSEFAKMPIPKREMVEITEVLHSAIQLHANTENCTIDYEITDEKLFVITDEQLMGRILANLIINAKQAVHTHKEACIDIHLKRTDDDVIISIADNGEGIPDEIKDKVFIPNFSTKYTGSGLGLAIAKRGVEHAGGSIWFENNEAGGTVFFIKLPLA